MAITITKNTKDISVNQTTKEITVAKNTKEISVNKNTVDVRFETFAEQWQGDWTSGTAYQRGNLTEYQGAIYVCVSDITGTTNPLSDTTHWEQTFSLSGLTEEQSLAINKAKNMKAHSSAITYNLNDWVYGVNNRIYVSLQNSNINKDPLTETAYWLQIGGADDVVVDWDDITNKPEIVNHTPGTGIDIVDGVVSIDDTVATKTYATQAATNAVAAVIDTAPASLDTLNELAAALNDDANFASTITSQLSNKLNTSDFNSTFDTRLDGKTTDAIDEGAGNKYFTTQRARESITVNDISYSGTSIDYDNTSGVITYQGPSQEDVLSYLSGGTGITINGSGIISSTITQYTNTLARQAISVIDAGGDGSFAYDNTTGVLTYTGPSAQEVWARFTAGAGISIVNGEITSTITQYDDSDVHNAISVVDAGGDGSVSYLNGVITFTGPTAAEVRAHFSAGTGITITDGVVAVDSTIATKAYADNAANTAAAAVVASAPETLNTLNEIANALGNDANYASSVATALGTKFPTAEFNATFDGRLSTKSTSDVAEGTNLYYTTARANTDIDNRLATKTTDNLAEGTTNVYYTSARANSDFDTRLATKTTTNVAEGTNLYYTQGRFDTAFDAKSTDALDEGTTNKYYTDARVDTRLATKTTDNLAEGTTNQYFSDTRARNALTFVDNGGDGSFAYNQNTGVMTYNGPSAAEVRTHFSGGTGITITNGTVAVDTNNIATRTYADTAASNAVSAVINAAPATLDTLNELATALGNDANFSTTITNSIATKLNSADFNSTFDTRLGTKSTTDIAEGTNLYFTSARSNTAFDNRLATKSTDNLTEGATNKYYTESRFNTSLSTKTTDDITEGTNLYYTANRFNTAFGTKSTDNLAEGTTNLYYTDGRFDTRLAGKSTSNLTEGTNLYWTTTRGNANFDSRLSTKNTDNLTEGTSNLYFTNTRARGAISLTDTGGDGTMSYNSQTGVFTYTGPSAAEVRAHFTAGNNITIVDGVITSTAGGGIYTAGTGIDITDGVISATGVPAEYTDEQAQDAAALMITNGTALGLTTTYSDATNVINQQVVGMYAYITNAEATTLLKGEAVYLFSASGDRATVKRAFNTSDATSAKTFGLANENIVAGGQGYVITQGTITGLDTSMYLPGTTLYLGATAGTLTATKPVAPNHLVYIGVVEKSNAGGGIIYVRTQNGYELDEIHDVLLVSETDNQVLQYDSATGLWKNSTLNADDITEGTTNLFYTSTRFNTDFDTRLGTKSTTNLTEGDNLYYTTARVNTAFDTRLATKSTSDIAEGTNLYFTEARAHNALTVVDNDGEGSLTYVGGTLTYTGPSTADIRGKFSASTGITITDGAIASTITQYTDAMAHAAISVVDNGGDGSLSYGSGVITYTGPSASETRAHFSSGSGISLVNGQISVDSTIATKTYADDAATTAVANVIAAAPSTLDTLNELAAALGDDPNFATTITTALGNKVDVDDFNALAQNTLAGVNTDGLAEGTTNLYYTTARFDTRLATKTTTDLAEGTNLYYTPARFDTRLALKSTTDIAEGTNLYYTTARQNTDFDTRLGTKSTTDIAEGTNLYYTDARVDTRLGTKTTDNLSEGTTNKYFSNTLARGAISVSGNLSYDSGTGVISYTTPTTDGITEGSTNLYYTSGRFDTAFGLKTTDNLTEGTTNKYFSNTLARGAFSAGTGITITDGVIAASGGGGGATYSISAESVGGGAILRLTGSDTTTDDITFTANDAYIQVSRDDANTIGLQINRDGIVAGLLTEVAGDSTPQLGGDLDVNGHSITSASNGHININPNGTGFVSLGANQNHFYVSSNSPRTSYTNHTKGMLFNYWNGATSTNQIGGFIFKESSLSYALVKNGTYYTFNGGVLVASEYGDLQIAGLTSTTAYASTSLTTPSITNNGTLALTTTNDGNISLTPGGTGVLVLDGNNFPTTSGSNGQVLTTNGAGQLSWTTVSGGSASTGTITFSGNTLTGNASSDVIIDAATSDTAFVPNIQLKAYEVKVGNSLVYPNGRIVGPAGGGLELAGDGTAITLNPNNTVEILALSNVRFYSPELLLGIGVAVPKIATANNTPLLLQGSTSGTDILVGSGGSTTSGNHIVLRHDVSTGYVIVGPGGGTGRITTNGASDLQLNTNAGTNSGTITLTQGANGNINIAPNGTGQLTVSSATTTLGSGSAGATLKSNGAYNLTLSSGGTRPASITLVDGVSGYTHISHTHNGLILLGNGSLAQTISSNGANNLILNTNQGTNSGTIQIAQGANANISLTPNGTGKTSIGNLVFTETLFDLGTTGGTIAPNAANGGTQKITLNSALTLNGFTSPVAGQSLTLIIYGGTAYTSLTSTMKFSGGDKSLSGTAGCIDIMTIYFDGTTYFASINKGFA